MYGRQCRYPIRGKYRAFVGAELQHAAMRVSLVIGVCQLEQHRILDMKTSYSDTNFDTDKGRWEIGRELLLSNSKALLGSKTENKR